MLAGAFFLCISGCHGISKLERMGAMSLETVVYFWLSIVLFAASAIIFVVALVLGGTDSDYKKMFACVWLMLTGVITMFLFTGSSAGVLTGAIVSIVGALVIAIPEIPVFISLFGELWREAFHSKSEEDETEEKTNV